jgi:omega-6 fatty acid desaturase (delta-12 desaturase)
LNDSDATRHSRAQIPDSGEPSPGPIARPNIGALRAIAARFRTPTIGRSLGQVIDTFGPFLLLWAAMYWSLGVSYWLTLALAVPAAGLVVRIFIIQHDCGHGSFMKKRWANHAVGWLCSLATLTPFDSWKRQHALHHANWNNLDRRESGRDIYSVCITLEEYRAMSMWGRLRHRLEQHPLVALVLVPPLVFVLLFRVPFDSPRAWRRERRAVWLTNLALLAVFGTLALTLGWRELLLVQAPITVIASIVGVWLFSLQHRFERTYWARADKWNAADASLLGSSFLRLPKVLQWFTGSIGFHHIHHLDTGVPNYRLEACYASDPGMRTAPTMGILGGFRAWRYALWDEAAGHMVPFPRWWRRLATNAA